MEQNKKTRNKSHIMVNCEAAELFDVLWLVDI